MVPLCRLDDGTLYWLDSIERVRTYTISSRTSSLRLTMPEGIGTRHFLQSSGTLQEPLSAERVQTF
jgi:hypothetical protein